MLNLLEELTGPAGYRLQRLQVYNWGTFHEGSARNDIWELKPDGQNTLLMDAATFGRYHGGRGAGFVAQALPSLTAEEQALYQELLRTNGRLEQKQLPAQYVAAVVQQTVIAVA